MKKVKADELIQDDKNFNLGTEKGKRLLEKSIKETGAGRSILIDKDNKIIAGNKTQEAFLETGGKDVIVVETTGDQLVAVKRTDVSLDSQQGRTMALADNYIAAESLNWDNDSITTELDENTLDAWEFEVLDEQKEETPNYTRKIEAPHYSPSETKPNLKELCDYSKYIKLKKEIEASDISLEEKLFLFSAAQRHIVFNYSKIADFYAHSDEKVQKLMEKSALVIIDFDDAVKNGFVKLTSDLREQFQSDHEVAQ